MCDLIQKQRSLFVYKIQPIHDSLIELNHVLWIKWEKRPNKSQTIPYQIGYCKYCLTRKVFFSLVIYLEEHSPMSLMHVCSKRCITQLHGFFFFSSYVSLRDQNFPKLISKQDKKHNGTNHFMNSQLKVCITKLHFFRTIICYSSNPQTLVPSHCQQTFCIYLF